jgi:hypothetical protein
MAKKFYYIETDSEAILQVNADLTGSTVRVIVRLSASSTPFDLPATIQPGTKGRITVDISSLTQNVYQIQIKQLSAAGKTANYPNKGWDLLIIGDDFD